MQRIYYVNDSVLTGTEIARAVLEYAAALARSDSSETVSIPVRKPDGSTARATLLIGPASQLIYEEEESEYEELNDDILVAKLKAATTQLGAPRAVTAEAASTDAVDVGMLPDGDDSLEWL
jgi:hypothetical protein